MSLSDSLSRISRLRNLPLGYVSRRLIGEARKEADRFVAPLIARRIDAGWLVRKANVRNIDELWETLLARPFPLATDELDPIRFKELFHEATAKIPEAADRAINRRIDLLGTGDIDLGTPVDWLKDYKTGDRWPPEFCRSIDYVNRGRPSDVKIPWEISRLQWLIPAGQAYRLTADEKYSVLVRDLIDEWISANPYAWTINWSCTMEPALRILTWTWLFHQFGHSQGWQDSGFRGRFLSALYLHGRFVERHIEKSYINGNHLTADAAGMVFAGYFFGDLGDAPRWAATGWNELCIEIERQVHPDGVDFEASVPYHRLVTELFLLPARFRQVRSLPVDSCYANRLKAMASFVAAYSRPDGSSPVWGDADDGRAIPLGTTGLADHRYLIALIGLTFEDKALTDLFSGPSDEIAWHFGTGGSDRLAKDATPRAVSRAFPDGGFYVLADEDNHVFVDCGPVGLVGRGGHGHNDALSFEAWLAGTPIIIDPGSYCYTASFEERNAFRATASHNTPQIDGEEINRFYSPTNLWSLHDDAKCKCLSFETSADVDTFVGLHRGYERLVAPVTVVRTLRLDHASGSLTIHDEIKGSDSHEIRLPLHLATNVMARELTASSIVLVSGTQQFRIEWSGDDHWTCGIESARISPSYGVAYPSQQLVWKRSGPLPVSLTISITPWRAS
jgi:hypothetical protein